MKRFICIELLDHTTDEEAQEFADEINGTFQPHYDAVVCRAEELPHDAELAKAANELGIEWPIPRS